MTGTHTEHESHPWQIRIPDHPARTDSPGFKAARATMQKILATMTEYPFGPGPWQAHHGGSWWTHDGDGWFLVIAPIGVEWSGQWACDGGKLDRVRQVAVRHYARFPETLTALQALGYGDAEAILSEPIKDAEGIARWVDSIYNSCVPLASGVHVGVISHKNPSAGGRHHFPAPITDLQFVVRDDFDLWVVDQKGRPMAVAPTAPRGSGDGRVELLYGHPGSRLARQHHAAHAKGERLILPDDHPLAKQAFARQTG